MKKVIVLIVLSGLSINMTTQESMNHNIFEIIHSEFGSEEFEINDPKYNIKLMLIYSFTKQNFT